VAERLTVFIYSDGSTAFGRRDFQLRGFARGRILLDCSNLRLSQCRRRGISVAGHGSLAVFSKLSRKRELRDQRPSGAACGPMFVGCRVPRRGSRVRARARPTADRRRGVRWPAEYDGTLTENHPLNPRAVDPGTPAGAHRGNRTWRWWGLGWVRSPSASVSGETRGSLKDPVAQRWPCGGWGWTKTFSAVQSSDVFFLSGSQRRALGNVAPGRVRPNGRGPAICAAALGKLVAGDITRSSRNAHKTGGGECPDGGGLWLQIPARREPHPTSTYIPHRRQRLCYSSPSRLLRATRRSGGAAALCAGDTR